MSHRFSLAAGLTFAVASVTAASLSPSPVAVEATLVDSSNALVAASETVSRYIVRGESVDRAAFAVRAALGSVVSELHIINAVAADLTESQASTLLARAEVTLFRDRVVQVSGLKAAGGAGGVPDSTFSDLVDAARLHAAGIDGSGIGIAFVDSGLWKHSAKSSVAMTRWADVLGDATSDAPASEGSSWRLAEDKYGHGSHLASIAAGSQTTSGGDAFGVAPGAHIVAVRAFDASGQGSYTDAIEGIDYVVRHKDELGIRVLNLSFGAEPGSFYFDDPVNQAAMAAWEAGIVVVTSAGNGGDEAMTITVPGNVPYVITVGAISDNSTPFDLTDDFLTSFSAAGPTVEGFIKPDLVAPGNAIPGLVDPSSVMAVESKTTNPSASVNDKYVDISGTSQSAAITSGVVALMLQADPALSADDVKCRLVSAAHATAAPGSADIYSVFQQGAGLVNAYDAVMSTASGCANVGLDIAADISGGAHYAGPVDRDEDGTFFVIDENGNRVDADGYTWGRVNVFADGYTWGRTTLFNEGYTWGRTTLFNEGYTWGRTNGSLLTQGYTWGRFISDILDVGSVIAHDPAR